MPMSLITPIRVLMHCTAMVVVWRMVRTNKLTIPTFTVRHSNAVITILVTTVSHVIPWTVYIVVVIMPTVVMPVSMTMTMTMTWRR